MNNSLHIRRVAGSEIAQYIPALAQLRLETFRDFPYLYDNTLAYEEKYLSIYTQAPDFLLVVASHGDEVVGAATALPLEHLFKEHDIIQYIESHSYTPSEFFYIGETMLKKDYRGQGVGILFLATWVKEYEHYVKSSDKFQYVCFCTVQRSVDHPKRPTDYVSLEEAWRKRGYTKHPELQLTFFWKDIDESKRTPKKMDFWMKKLS
jgi:GNAT superfamily N-acetyltransferase